MKNKRGNVVVIALVMVIVAITAGVVGWMFAKKSQIPVQQEVVKEPVASTVTNSISSSTNTQPIDETINWQTFTNTKFGYEIKYPKDKFSDPISFKNSGNPVAMSSQDLNISELGIIQSGMDLNISAYDDSSLDNAYKKETSIVEYVSLTKENIKFNEFNAIQYVGQSRGNTLQGLIIQKNNSIIALGIRFAPNSKNATEIFNKIVSTLKFIN